MKKKIRLGCPNKDCKNYKKNEKFKSAVAECPECGSKLVHICKSKSAEQWLMATMRPFVCFAKRKERTGRPQQEKVSPLEVLGCSALA